MRALLSGIRWLFLVCFLVGVVGCAGVTPKGPTQIVYSAEWTLIGAANSVADLHDGGTLTGKAYDDAKGAILQAKAALDAAKVAKASGDAATAEGKIRIAQSILNQLAAALAAKGK